MRAYGVTDIGRQRKLNEDFYYLPEAGERFIAVADGMGGHAAGEVASLMAITLLTDSLRRSAVASETRLKEAFVSANERVYHEAAKDASREGMGTTLTVVWVCGNTCYLGHVGDSRAYRLREGKLEQLSIDHSYVEELVQSGVITREQARTHPKRNLITRCIGVFREIDPQIVKLDWRESDVWFLCSDGLSGYVRDSEIESCLNDADLSPAQKLKELKDLALERGGADNITLAMLTGGNDA